MLSRKEDRVTIHKRLSDSPRTATTVFPSLRGAVVTVCFASIAVFAAVGVPGTPPRDSLSKQRTVDSLKNAVHAEVVRQAELLVRKNDSLSRLDSIQKEHVHRLLSRVRPSNSTELARLQLRIDSISQLDSLRTARQKMEIAARRHSLSGYPVFLGKDTLFLVYLNTGAFTAPERAHAVRERVKRLTILKTFSPDSLRMFSEESGVDIFYDTTAIMTVSDMDALWNSVSKDSLATQYRTAIGRGVASFRRANSLFSYVMRGVSILAILVLCVIIAVLIRRFIKLLRSRIAGQRQALTRGVSIKNISILSGARQYRLFNQAVTTLAILAYVVLAYATLSLLFYVLPSTKDISKTLLDWVLSPLKALILGIVTYLPKLFHVAVIVFVMRFAIRIARRFFDEIARGNLRFRGFYDDWAHPTFNIVRFLLYALMFVMIFPYLPGSDSAVFRGVSVFLGLLLSLGSTSAISNVVAGLVITYMRPFRVGDRISVGVVTGDVIEKTLLVTRVRTIKNEDITIPNAGILSGHTVNYSSPGKDNGVIIHSTVSIGYGVPWRKVHETLVRAALSTPNIRTDKQPFVLQKSLDDFYVTYEINAYTDEPQLMMQTYSDLHQNIQDLFAAASIEIMSPHYRAMRNGDQPTIPRDRA